MSDHTMFHDQVDREGDAPAEPPGRGIRRDITSNASTPAPSHKLGRSLALPHESPDARRRHPVHGIKYVDGQPTIIFDTICTKHRKPWLANDEFHGVFQHIAATATAWLMGRYVIMPDHIHFFAADIGGAIEYENWVTYVKSQLTKAYKRPQCRWLTDHWDTRIRNADVYEAKWQYFLNNPVRKGLVARSEDWPYQGEIYELRWT